MDKRNSKKSGNILRKSGGRTSEQILTPQKKGEINEIVKKLLVLTRKFTAGNQDNWQNHVAIDKLLNKLQNIEPKFNTERKREDSFPGLIKWFKENGGIAENITISKFGQMEYGLEATKDLDVGELICAVPRNLMMSLENIVDSPLNYLFQNDPILKTMGNVALSLFLILEYLKGESSFWHSYISSLPTQYNTVLYFTSDDLAELKNSPTFEPAIQLCKCIARHYAYFKNLFQTSNDEASKTLRNTFTYQLYRWAVSTVMTRQNYIPVYENSEPKVTLSPAFTTEPDKPSGINAFIPLWDMCNHGQGHNSTNYKDGRSECYALKDFKKTEQILIYYGTRNNCDFFIHNGFTYENNENDSFRLFLGVSKADPLYKEKKEVLEILDFPVSGNFYLLSGSEPFSDRLLDFLRIYKMSDVQLDFWCSKNDAKCLKTNEMLKSLPQDNNLEVKVWSFLIDRINLLLIGYKGVVEIEVDAPISEHRRLIRTQLLLEKKILQNALEQAKLRLEKLSC